MEQFYARAESPVASVRFDRELRWQKEAVVEVFGWTQEPRQRSMPDPSVLKA